MIAFVRGVIAARTVSAVMFWVSRSTSAMTGVAPRIDDATGGSDECSAGDDDFVARADAERVQRQFKCDGSVRHRDRVFAPERGRIFRFELPPFVARPVIHFAGAQGLRRGLDHFIVERRPWRERLCSQALAAIDGQGGCEQ